MSNAEREEVISGLIDEIKNGANKILDLWAEVEKLVYWWSYRLAPKLPGVEADELASCGYMAMCNAVETFNGSGSFAAWLYFYYKTEITEMTGRRTNRQKNDPLHHAQSLDAPIPGADDLTLGDAIPNSEDAFEEVEGKILNEQLHEALEKALSILSPEQEYTIRQRFYNSRSLKNTGEDLGVSPERARQIETKALRNLRTAKISRELREYIEEQTPYYMRASVKRFKTTGTSAVEEIVLFRERLQENILRRQ